MTEFSRIITDLRKKKGFNQAEMAEKVGINRATLSDYERGKTEPSFSTLLEFAKYFRVTTDFLLGYTSKNVHLFSDTDSNEISQKCAPECAPNSAPDHENESVFEAAEPSEKYNNRSTRSDKDYATTERLLRVVSEVFAHLANIERRLTDLEDKDS